MIAARLLTRLAILVASLAWGSAVFVHTVGDPDRAADIAAAVLADDEARAEVVTPVTAAVMRSTGLPVEQQPVVAAEVDRILRDPAGAATFIEPFVGSWAATLGIDDPRSSQLDVSRLVALSPALAALQPPSEGGAAVLPSISDLPLPAVGAAEGIPFFDGGFGWVGGLDRVAGAAVVPLAVVALVLAGVALVIGDRRPILRRLGAWAIGAGAFWLVFPAVAVWLARRWATGADAVVDVAVGEATSGLVFPALVLVLAGAGALTVSFAVAPAGSGPDAGSAARSMPRSMPRSVEPTPGRPPLHPRDEDRRYSGALAARAAEGSSTQRMETTRPEPLDRTAVMPGVVPRTESPQPERWPAPGEPSSRPVERAPAERAPAERGSGEDPDGDDLWSFYGRR